jgi:hypothetical protein
VTAAAPRSRRSGRHRRGPGPGGAADQRNRRQQPARAD